MEVSAVVGALVLGLLLSLSTGLRAFLAPFGLSLAMFFGWLDLGPSLSWLASPIALVTFGSAIVFEIGADKFPVVDHAMDALHVVIKPLAGTLVAYSMMEGVDPVVASVGSLSTGGLIAGTTHLAKASVRVGSSTCSAGTCNPLISIVEDLLAVALAGGAIWGVSVMG